MSEYIPSTMSTNMIVPDVMTPNTIKTIEQSILASLEGTTANPTIIASQATGSFVPPLPSQQVIVSNQSCWQGGQILTQSNHSNTHHHSNNVEEMEEDYLSSSGSALTTTEDYDSDRKVVAKGRVKKGGRGKVGGRRPRGSGDPQEDERRKVRRERNKLAAARCRKRRVDHTNMLMQETSGLEDTRRALQAQIEKLQAQKDELEFILEAHIPNCNNSKTITIKPDPDAPITLTHATLGKPKRPTTLPVQSSNNSVLAGIPISTPSNGLINFDHIDWNELPSTGLTPTVTSVSNSLVTPLVTPSTANAILSSLGCHGNSNKFVSL